MKSSSRQQSSSPARPRACITGATSGIGAAFAARLAAEKYDLIVCGRRRERLERLAQRLQTTHGVAIDILTGDLSDERYIRKLETHISRLPALDLLVNNAGYTLTGQFHELEGAALADLIATNATAVVRCARAAIDVMYRQNSGSIINVASIAAYTPAPGSVVYCATKSFVVAFTEGLYTECALNRRPIRLQALCPGWTRTDFHSRRGIMPVVRYPWMMVSGEYIAARALRDLRRGRLYCIPKPWNYFTYTVSRYMPRRLFLWAMTQKKRIRRDKQIGQQ
jgi:hypothetical protein